MKKKYLVLIALFCVMISEGFAQTSQMYLDSGSYYLDKKQYIEAIKALNKCIEMDSNEIEAYAIRAFALYHMNHFIKAIEDCNRALAIHEGYAELYNLRALCKDQSGNRQGACTDWHLAYYYGFDEALKMIRQFCKENRETE